MSILTVAVLIAVANIKDISAVPTLAPEKYLPIYNVQTGENKKQVILGFVSKNNGIIKNLIVLFCK